MSAWNCWSLRALSNLAFLMSAAFRRFAHLKTSHCRYSIFWNSYCKKFCQGILFKSKKSRVERGLKILQSNKSHQTKWHLWQTLEFHNILKKPGIVKTPWFSGIFATCTWKIHYSLCIETINRVFDFIRVYVTFIDELSTKIIYNTNTLFIGIQLLWSMIES